ncbi:mannose-1-phosphate guanylyltransferase/mannose-6-phosphate isomerase [Archaeoglobus veneficus]|uniref:mannose-1-phosphate guanylyltransferase n=1 Tax=Archaeoglobus veneficus (strain DSM 11195 / SNP6) TaxID=693661 RepID=F2KNW2_ARCVS|nr:mannose-1-phosphate guanylyltransferase/mannose-6-phosphate isomerase [Archaeoglobus veneficus]AEA47439.1 mannose-1-phosphate guanylyltransferase/mannose-6-phosphate isomerase [Archaeoglobus veneficus SNP6]
MKTIILAGGSGTRLWPLSREFFPKQFIKLFDKSLFQLTLQRALIFSSPEDIYVVTNEKQRFIALDQIAELGLKIPTENVIAEPLPKNTLPAICYTVLTIVKQRDKGGKVAVLPSDHLVEANDNYIEAFRRAERLAEKHLVTFGIKPARPHTGYGYIKPGNRLENGFKVERFVEKPDEERAKKYITEGFLWNSGMFLFDTDVFIEECRKHAPQIIEAFEEKGIEAYTDVPEVSIDYGLMEKTDRAAVVELNTFWSDVGSFDALYEIMKKNGSGNAVKGECITIDSSNNLIYSERLVAAVGVRDSIIVDTKDALLVCSRGDAQKVKEVVKVLKDRKDRRAESHLTIYRPWGSYTILEEERFYRINKVTVLPKRGLKMQVHHHRSEHWVVVKGMAKVTVGDREFFLRSGESTFVPAGTKHRIENPGLMTLEVIEVQIGECISDEDVVWFDE